MKLSEILKKLFQGKSQQQKPQPPDQRAATPKTTPKTSTEMYVFVTPKGKKFHYTPSCSSLHSAKPIKMGISKARKAGYSACDKCCYAYLH